MLWEPAGDRPRPAPRQARIAPRRPRRGGARLRERVRALAGWALACLALPAPANDLVVLIWPGYLDPALVARFEAAHGVQVGEVNFESDDARDAMMIETGGAGFDVVLVNGSNLDAQTAHGWLAPLALEHLPNLKHVEPRWRSAFPAAERYGVPYFWGLIGIAYHRDRLAVPVTRWMDLFRPRPELHGSIAMLNNVREVTAIALMALGYPGDSTDAAALEAAAALLQEQTPYVHTYEYQGLRSARLASGEIAAALSYSGDWVVTHREHPEIDYVVPLEGTVLWVDYLAVASVSRNQPLAWRFIDFLNEPDNALQLAEFVSYPTPNRAAAARLSRDLLENPVIYPPPEVLARAVALSPPPPQALRRMNSAFARLTD
jgi:spermidine/putrescine transport system substrate-binding protein